MSNNFDEIYKQLMERILIEAKDRIKKYQDFKTDILEFSNKIGHINLNNMNSVQLMEYNKLMKTDESIKKLNRLALALLYVENPTDKEIYTALIDDINSVSLENKDSLEKKDKSL